MKIPSNFRLIVSLILITFCISFSADRSKKTINQQNIHNLLLETLSKNNIPGMIAAIVDSTGIKLIESVGVRNINATEQITNDDLFHLGSCTKAMTGTLLATLVAKNEIKWETTILDVFPELKDSIHRDFHNVTLHQLLTHRAGIQANAKNWWINQNMEIKDRRISIIKENLQEQSLIKSGEYSYSNLGYMIAGSMAERITGQSWETLINKRLFEPLEMKSAGFGPPGIINQNIQPWGHIKNFGKWQPKQEDNAEALGPAGRIHCSIEDWAKFISLFLKHDSSEILTRNEIDKLIDPIGDYACGWGVGQHQWANGITIMHSGSNTMWYITVWIAPEINRAFIVGTNSSDENSGKICDTMIGKLIEINQYLQ